MKFKRAFESSCSLKYYNVLFTTTVLCVLFAATCAFTASGVSRKIMPHHPATFTRKRMTFSILTPLSHDNYQNSRRESGKKNTILMSTVFDSIPDVDGGKETDEEVRKELEKSYRTSPEAFDEELLEGSAGISDTELSASNEQASLSDVDDWTKRKISQTLEGIKKSNIINEMKMKIKDMKAQLDEVDVPTKDEVLTTVDTTSFHNASTMTGTHTTSTATSLVEDENLKKEIERCNKMRISELKKELKDLGVSTKSFFEKGELVRELAKIRLTGVKKSDQKEYEQSSEYDPSYKDVIMHKYYPQYYYDESGDNVWTDDDDVIDINYLANN